MQNLCIDFGSTFIKFWIFEGSACIFKEKLDFPKPSINDGIVYEVSIQDINKSVYAIFEKAKVFDIQKCYIAVQMHGYVLKNSDGSFSDYVSWKDRSGDIANPILRGIDFIKNGTSLKCNLPITKLLSTQSKVEFFTLGSYIAYLLTARNITHRTDACASGFFDADTLKPINISQNIALPEVTATVISIGTYEGIKIYTPVGDHQLSFLGSDAQENAYLLNIGTATQISTLSDEYENNTNFEKRPNYEKRPYFNHKRLLTISGLTGGEALFAGYNPDTFCKEILSAIKIMPPKRKMLVGGGGTGLIFDRLEAYFKKLNIECIQLDKNISQEGLIRLINMNNPKIGTMLSEICFPNFPIILKNEKLDFLIVDQEHGSFDYSFLSAVIMNARLIGLPLIVRLPDNNRRDITKLVDMGVSGLLLPMTNNADDIKQVVNYAKYMPVGKRGISTNRAHTLYSPPPIDEYIVTANKMIKIYAQIETKAGVENIDDILSVNGVEGVFVGPNDLSCDLNCIGNHQPIQVVLEKVSLATRKQNKTWGIITTSKELMDFSLQNGVNYISFGSEINMLKDSCKALKARIL